MSNIIRIPGRDHSARAAVEAEARAWLIRLDQGRPGRRELREFREWLQRHPAHRDAFARTMADWNSLDDLAGLLAAEAAPVPECWRRRMVLAAAGLLVILGLAAALQAIGLGFAPERNFTASYATRVGEQRTVILPDGSRIRMNTASNVEVAYQPDYRFLHLNGGEAWFEVAHDRTRPFIVYAGKYAVKAVGTAFSVRVREHNQGIDLAITSGRIEVATLKQRIAPRVSLNKNLIDKAVARIPLNAGQHAVFNEGIELAQRMQPVEMEKMLSWRDGMLIFDNDSLQHVVSEISRYTPIRIVISDHSIENLRFGGYFHVNDVSSILATLEQNFGLHVEKINDHLIYLSRRPPPAPSPEPAKSTGAG